MTPEALREARGFVSRDVSIYIPIVQVVVLGRYIVQGAASFGSCKSQQMGFDSCKEG